MKQETLNNWRNANSFVSQCSKCKDWEQRGLSNHCPSCDSDILMEYERRESNTLLNIYYYQDGQDFYIFQKPEDVSKDDGLWKVFTSIIKVPDWDVEAAQAARQNFLDAYCKEHFLNPIKLKMF